jgi:hypothetical protein
MANPLRDAFDFVIASYGEWFAAVRTPWACAARTLAGDNDEEHIKRATAVWFASMFLSLVITLPIYRIYGLRLENVGFQLTFVLVQYLALVTLAFIIHRGCLLAHIPSRFSDTFSLYTVVVAAASPFITLLRLPSLQQALYAIMRVKARHLSGLAAAEALVNAPVDPRNNLTTAADTVADPLLMALLLFVGATVIVLIAEHYGVEERRAVRGMAMGLTLFWLPLGIIFAALQQTILYIFVEGS